MDRIKDGLIRLSRIVILMFIVAPLIVFLNYLSNNKLASVVGTLQEEYSILTHQCNETFNIDNGVLTLNEFVFKKGFGNCVDDLKKARVKLIVLGNVYGGDVTETRVLSKYVKEKQIPVLIKGTCSSSCLDVVLHSPVRHLLKGGKIGIHAYSVSDEYHPFFNYFSKTKADSMLNAFEDTNVNIDFIKGVMNVTPPEAIHYPEYQTLLSNNIINNVN